MLTGEEIQVGGFDLVFDGSPVGVDLIPALTTASGNARGAGSRGNASDKESTTSGLKKCMVGCHYPSSFARNVQNKQQIEQLNSAKRAESRVQRK